MYYVSLKQFEGPLDLLLHLITRAKVDIKDIFVSEITEQYLDYLSKMEEFDLEISSEFLYMASELLLIKSKMLLPRHEEEEEDPRQNLADRLIEYEKIKKAKVETGNLNFRFFSFSSKRLERICQTQWKKYKIDNNYPNGKIANILMKRQQLSHNRKFGEFQEQLFTSRIDKVHSCFGILTRTFYTQNRSDAKTLMLDFTTFTQPRTR